MTEQVPTGKKPLPRVTVNVRLRPILDFPQHVYQVRGNGILVRMPRDEAHPYMRSAQFWFDKIFNIDATQDNVYTGVGRRLTEECLRGQDPCCFAYGQSGSGKTYTMYGNLASTRDQGLVPRCVTEVLEAVGVMKDSGHAVTITANFVEIYQDHLRDLGNATNFSDLLGIPLRKARQKELSFKQGMPGDPLFDYARQSLDIIEDPQTKNTYVKGLFDVEVNSLADAMHAVRCGHALRETHMTANNETSSRSHTVFILKVRMELAQGAARTGTISLIDLAGTERVKKSQSSGQRLKEATHINQSLSALGKIILNLSEETGEGEKNYVPYRDTKMTRMLKDSFEGESTITVLCCATPDERSLEESLSTLWFAQRCKYIEGSGKVTGIGGDADHEALRSYIETLETMVANMQDENAELRAQVDAMNHELDVTHAHYSNVLQTLGGADAQVKGRSVQLEGVPAEVLKRVNVRADPSSWTTLRLSAGGTTNTAQPSVLAPTKSNAASGAFSLAAFAAAKDGPSTSDGPRISNDPDIARKVRVLEKSALEMRNENQRLHTEVEELRTQLDSENKNNTATVKGLRAKIEALEREREQSDSRALESQRKVLEFSRAEARRLREGNAELLEQLAELTQAMPEAAELRERALAQGQARMAEATEKLNRQHHRNIESINRAREKALKDLMYQHQQEIDARIEAEARMAGELTSAQIAARAAQHEATESVTAADAFAELAEAIISRVALGELRPLPPEDVHARLLLQQLAAADAAAREPDLPAVKSDEEAAQRPRMPLASKATVLRRKAEVLQQLAERFLAVTHEQREREAAAAATRETAPEETRAQRRPAASRERAHGNRRGSAEVPDSPRRSSGDAPAGAPLTGAAMAMAKAREEELEEEVERLRAELHKERRKAITLQSAVKSHHRAAASGRPQSAARGKMLGPWGRQDSGSIDFAAMRLGATTGSATPLASIHKQRLSFLDAQGQGSVHSYQSFT
ncbi:unnamed protein product [Pedinophyceae sp. YPF-701]|nr:unnamed protein product [Pedinophyceae sp. YPF-701]